MKTLLIAISLLLLCCSNISSKETGIKSNPEDVKTIHVYSSPELFELATNLACEYSSMNASIKIKIDLCKESEIQELLKSKQNLVFISNEQLIKLQDESIWKIIVGRDAIVPIFNDQNPFIEEIYQQGISTEKLALIANTTTQTSWVNLIQNRNTNTINFYSFKGQDFALMNSLDPEPNKYTAIPNQLVSQTQVIEAIQKDPYAMGFCKLADIMDDEKIGLIKNIKLVPIDKNGNGQLDFNEKIYDDLQSFMRGVWIGKYPQTLTSNVYTIALNKPTDKNEIAFLKWVITDGQQLLNTTGFYNIVSLNTKENLEMLGNAPETIQSADSKNYILLIAGIIVVFIIISFLVFFILGIGQKKEIIQNENKNNINGLNQASIKSPKGIFYDKTHTWAYMEQDGNLKIGIADFLQHVTGQFTRVKMKNPGDKIKKGEQLITLIQNGKQLDIYSPVSGTIKTQNSNICSQASLINSSPYTDGWLYTIEPSSWLREIQFLLLYEKYNIWISDELNRLKNFLALSIKPNNDQYAMVILQNGGELKDNPLEELGPELWEDFQRNFIDIQT